MSGVAFATETAARRFLPSRAAVRAAWEPARALAVHREVDALQPVLMKPDAYNSLFRATRFLTGCLRSLVWTLGTSFEERAERLSVPVEHLAVRNGDEDEHDLAAVFVRADALMVGRRVQFLEFNVGSGVDGVAQVDALQGVWREVYGNEHLRLASPSPVTSCAEMLSDLRARRGGSGSVIVLGTRRDYPELTDGVFTNHLASLRRAGFDACWMEPDELARRFAAGDLPRDNPYILRRFTFPEWDAQAFDRRPLKALCDRGSLMVAPASGTLLSSKKAMALLSEGRVLGDPAKQRVIDRYVPWTRVVADDRVAFEGGREHLPTLLRRRREDFVVKAAVSMEGRDVVIGRDTEPDGWAAAVDTALASDGGHVVQRFVAPDDVQLWVDDGRPETVRPVLSPFLIGGRPGGMMARYLPESRYGVVNYHNHGAEMATAMPYA